MAQVHGTCCRNMERSDRDMKGKSKRKRRRRCKGKGRSNMLSTLIGPIRHWDAGASSAEDADSSSTSSLEVNENQDDKIQMDCDLLRKYHPSTFCTTFPIHGPRALKRKQPLLDGKDRLLYQSHLTCKRAAWAVTQKNALVQLNELRPGLRYEIMSKTGPLHAPVFSVGVEVNGFRFEGRGSTKKQAKMRAAELALRSFIQFPNASQAHATMGNFTSTPTDFTADKLDIPDTFLKEFEPSLRENCDLLHCNTAKNEVFSSIYNHRRLVRLTLDLVSSTNPKRRALSTSLLEHLSPVVLLNELRPGLRYMCLTERVHGRPMRSFVMVVRVEGRVFEGCGHSKRLAKAQAAAAVLQCIYNISVGPERKFTGLQGSRAKNQLPQFFAESIFHLVREKYAELTDSCFSTSHARHKVLAGIVMTRGFDLRSAQVVSLATGTKCLDSDNVSDYGGTLSDCHAEVVSRRALVRFLYAQLELLLCKSADCEEQSIFVPNKGGVGGGGGGIFRLREGILFHMYVSSSPCGDARLNCPYETTAACETNIFRCRRFHCHLRVKVDGGEGTLPITARRANQKWDGVAAGKPLVTMSCTDKMANVVGLQGALLSPPVEPVYLHSLTVGWTLSHTGHWSRPVSTVRLSSSDIRPAGKAPNTSVNWSCGDGGLEEISTCTGRRQESRTPSRLCRRSVYARWQRLRQQLNGAEATPGTYSGSKMAAGRYQRAMQQFINALQGGGLGTWLRKPPELGHFKVSV
ncbi:LOW QUALITY PROTEIN: double-stranded RNA-specific editase B2-like [Morone saxatilis]|uniref:LOW QUALITY PROTEIN: double-stranded RNA-specific editase B2-like n=1 Tax=Morone saxatilis TaxID=34816 RepID=UPI0015E24636|nr:LOW QUALITY PROTEIN: double-stranded RNA-specific editase B2-like [Morone saxatilis]